MFGFNFVKTNNSSSADAQAPVASSCANKNNKAISDAAFAASFLFFVNIRGIILSLIFNIIFIIRLIHKPSRKNCYSSLRTA